MPKTLNESVYIQLSSNPKMATFLRNNVQKSCAMIGFAEEQIDMIVLAVDEAFTNIIRHGYKMDFAQKIDIYLKIHEGRYFKIILQDDAAIIDKNCIKSRCLSEIKPGGLGVHFLYTIMDYVEYTTIDERNALVMTKHLQEKSHTNRLTASSHQLLQTLLDIGRYVHQILDLDTLLNVIVTEVKNLIQCESVSVLLEDRNTQELFFHTVLDENKDVADKLRGLRFARDKGIAGKAFASGEPLLVRDVERNPHHYNQIDEDTGAKTSSLLYAPLKVQKRVIGLLGVKNKMDGDFSTQDVESAKAIASTVALSIDNAYAHERLQKAIPRLSETHRIKKEIESARLMHQATLPQSIPPIENLDISAICQPATEVGGDYYDFIRINDYKHAFAVGDVSGHGLEAGMMVSMARSCLYTQVNFSSSITDVMRAMNRMVCGSVDKNLMMTFLFAIYNTKNHMMAFANAGHPYPCHYEAECDEWAFITDGEFPLGIYGDYEYSSHEVQLHPKDFLVLYSDGILEASNAKKEHYGLDRLHALLSSKKWACAKEIELSILQDVRNFAQNGHIYDDLTILVIHIE
ncbi:SpoIIE family protein phosphatase [Candidatus Uabimicrobium sp. HlEnr_7]|uniref:SpoIIE family protein phosphatase n=1 Tax=Candidatus Uabimicrobium helgolandensis TaxID=3095367 RepID=UPI0035576365